MMLDRAVFWGVVIGWAGMVWGGAAQAQDMERVRAQVDTLCAPYFYGRGYVRNGVNRSADYLEGQFRELGLQAFEGGYQQPFTHAVNVFDGEIALWADSRQLALGTEFIAEAGSGAGSGEAETVFLPRHTGDERKGAKAANKIARTDYSGKAVVFSYDQLGAVYALPKAAIRALLKARCWVATAPVLTHRIADHQLPVPFFLVQGGKGEKLQAKSVRFSVQSTYQPKFVSRNVIGYVPGTAQPDSVLLFCAHHDHLGGMADRYFPGGNDNASGVAMLLELAAHYAENPAAYTVVFIAFGGEEAGLVGSKYYVEHPSFPLERISFLLNLDLFATGEKGVMAVNGKVFPKAYQLLSATNEAGGYLPEVKARGKAQNSDHYYFTEAGVPGFFFYLMGDWPHYHDVQDRPPLPLTRFTESYRLIVDFAERWMAGEGR